MLVEQPHAQANLTRYARVGGIFMDNIEKVTQEGGSLTVVGVTAAGKPRRKSGGEFFGARWQFNTPVSSHT